MKHIDINSDVGESFGAYKMGDDENVFGKISSANIACGFHGGDSMVMRQSVERAKKLGINVGAHPGLPDLVGFGRRKMDITLNEAKNYVIHQIGAIWAFCQAVKIELKHVKIHGALSGSMAAKDEKMAQAVIEGILEVNDKLILYCRPNTALSSVAEKLGLRQLDDFPVDRQFNSDNSPVNRRLPGAVIEDVDEVIKRTVRLIREGTLDTYDGKVLKLSPQSICVHGDNPNAINLLAALHDALKKEGIEVKPYAP